MAGISVYEIVTARIIDELEKGRIPWEKPWTGVSGRNGAWSRSTGKAYSLINQMLLGRPGEYITPKQCREAGGHIRKGEKSSIVVFWKQFETKETAEDGTEKVVRVPVLRYYSVFHIDQCEGVEAKYTPDSVGAFDPIAEAEALAVGYSARESVSIRHSVSDQAFYSPSGDYISLPLREQFPDTAEYYSTLFHEVVHSTGHSSRLNRLNTRAWFGNEEYSKEELCAEIGAAAILNHLGIETGKSFRNSAAYIQSWLKALKNDPKMIVSASGKADKAVAYILG